MERLALRIALSALLIALGISASFGQSEPPLEIPAGNPPPALGTAIPFEHWLFFPQVNAFATYSDNLFFSPQQRISVWGLGLSPSLTAEWSNGIHTTIVYGNFERRVYPTENEVNANDGQATLTQKYAPLRDLTFTAQVDYTHKTISNSLENSIPSGTSSPGVIRLPDGNFELPDGTIISPSGEIVGHATPGLSVTGLSLINPYDQYAGTFSVEKILNHGIFTLSDTVQRTNYETDAARDSSVQTFQENGAFWLGPLFYAYTQGAFSIRSASSSSTVYRLIGGLGTRQFGLFRASAYFGRQGSQHSGSAGGDVYGAKITYYAWSDLTFSATLDETINQSHQTTPSNLAQNLPPDIPIQLALSDSTRTTASTLEALYAFSPQWTMIGHLGYTHIEFIGSTRLNNVWLTDTTLAYSLSTNTTLSWEYQFADLSSNVPFSSAKRNFFMMSALYKF